MYQPELVRDSRVEIDLERVKAPKLMCLDIASNQVDLLDAVSISNVLLKGDNYIIESHKSLFDKIDNIYNGIGKKLDVMLSFISFIDHLKDIKLKEHMKNLQFPNLLKKILPKFGSPFYFTCCFDDNFSTLGAVEYLSFFTKTSSTKLPKTTQFLLNNDPTTVCQKNSKPLRKATQKTIHESTSTILKSDQYKAGSFEYTFIVNKKHLTVGRGIRNTGLLDLMLV
ncbi:hypothetical protein BB559_005551 [Furculomyces boomerangus]|uniref:Uncharacterized protein n=1 Tax=Furculomyces boomerangus TaxID=61424 RepID=A0A2T9Y823_9FUNG|nr:hypothetical protein BB559_005551 [Furculomyces boomerangus]